MPGPASGPGTAQTPPRGPVVSGTCRFEYGSWGWSGGRTGMGTGAVLVRLGVALDAQSTGGMTPKSGPVLMRVGLVEV